MADAITVHCPSCETAFPVDPGKVPEGGVNARCSECEDIFRVDVPVPEPEMEMGAGEPGDEFAEGPGAELAGGLETDDELPGFDVSEPGIDAGTEGPPELEETPSSEAMAEDLTEGVDEEDDWAEQYFSTTGIGDEAFGDAGEGVATEGPEIEEEAPAMEEDTSAEPVETEEFDEEPTPRMEEPGIAGPELDVDEVEAAEAEARAAEPFEAEPSETEPFEAEPFEGEPAEGEPIEPGSEEAEPLEAETAEPLEIGREWEEEEPAEEPRRPAFGNRSPEEKAQRLARVLVSDMITYNPNMYETALARGTLKEDFAEEIEKSWDEYVEQVGEDLATSTSHWTDALNDILAKGDDVF